MMCVDGADMCQSLWVVWEQWGAANTGGCKISYRINSTTWLFLALWGSNITLCCDCKSFGSAGGAAGVVGWDPVWDGQEMPVWGCFNSKTEVLVWIHWAGSQMGLDGKDGFKLELWKRLFQIRGFLWDQKPRAWLEFLDSVSRHT